MSWARILFFVFAVGRVYGQIPDYITFPSDIEWVTRQTEHFRILYRHKEDALALKTLAAAERAFRLLQPVFVETPPKTWIVLADFHDSLNGYAIDFPFPHFVLFASPPEPSGMLASLDEWLDSVVLHEYVHVLHLYPAHGIWSVMRSVFGSWVIPNGLMPSHLHEGMATFFETHFTQGGRGRGTAFPMYTRMAVKEGVWGKSFVPLDLLEGSIAWPQGASPYYFGYLFIEELWRRKQSSGIHDFVQHTSRSWPYWINHHLRKSYGADSPTLWAAIFKEQQQRASQEIRDIESRPLSALTYLTENRFHKWDLAASDRRLAYRQAHPDTGPTIEILGLKGQPKQTIELQPGQQEGLCWAGPVLVFSESYFQNGYALNGLQLYDARTQQRRAPTYQKERILNVHLVACDGPERVLTYQHTRNQGVVREWNAPFDSNDWTLRREWKVPQDSWVTSLVPTSPPLVAARKQLSTVVYLWQKQMKKIAQIAGHFFRFLPPLPSGEWPAIGTISGRDEVWGLDFKKKWARKLIAVLGGVNGVTRQGSQWWVSSYRHGGYDIAKATPIQSKGHRWADAPAPERNTAETPAVSASMPYRGTMTLAPRAWLPSMLVVPNGVQFSAWVPGFDISQKHVYNLFGGYDTRGAPFAIVDYSYRFDSRSLNFDLNFLPTYLISNREFLHQWGTSLGISQPLGYKLPSVSLSAVFRRIEGSSFGPAVQSVGLSAGLSGSFWVKTLPKAAGPRRGTLLSVNHSQFFQALGSHDNFYSFTAAVDQFVPVLWARRHALKLSGRLGLTGNTVLYNSFFQGGGELVFSPGRMFFLNRGFLPGTFLSRQLMTFNLDYLFPVFDIQRGLGQWPFFLQRLDAAIVGDVATLGQFVNYYWSTGLELKSHWKLFFYVPTLIRAGFYHGFGLFGEALYVTTAIEASL